MRPRMFTRLIAASVAGLATLASVATSQATLPAAARIGKPSTHRVLGVFDATTGKPIDQADVIDLFVDETYRTREAGLVGLWAFTSRNDSVAVRVKKIGYTDTAFVVMMTPADTSPVQIELRPAAALAAVLTSASPLTSTIHLREFEERRHDPALSGRFLGPEDLDKRTSRPITELIVDIAQGKARGCMGGVKVFVDGVQLPTGDLDAIRGQTAASFEGVEFYTMAATPLQFGGTAIQGAPRTTMMQSAAPGTAVGEAAGKASSAKISAVSQGCGTVLLWRRETAVP